MKINNKLNNTFNIHNNNSYNSKKTNAINTIVFDFDGTIIDTNQLIEEGLNYFSIKYRGQALTKNELSKLTGKTLEDQMAFIRADKAELIAEQFRIWYIHNHNAKTRVFPGVKELLDHLKLLGYRMAIVSNNSRETIEHGLRHLRLEEMFEMIITRDDVIAVKPSPEGLNRIKDYFGIDSDQCMYIGDTESDMIAAKAANIFSVMVGWTHLTQEQVRAIQPDWVLKEPNHLFMIMDAYILEGNQVAG